MKTDAQLLALVVARLAKTTMPKGSVEHAVVLNALEERAALMTLQAVLEVIIERKRPKEADGGFGTVLPKLLLEKMTPRLVLDRRIAHWRIHERDAETLEGLESIHAVALRLLTEMESA